MAAITAALIKQVREDTGAGMLDVKKALTEAEGDVARAKEIIRAKGIAAAGKREGRKAQEGTIASKVVETANGETGYAVELNSETDFVAKTPKFVEFSEEVLGYAVDAEANSADELLEAKAGDSTVKLAVEEAAALFGEHVKVGQFAKISGEHVEVYAHKKSAEMPPSIVAMIATDKAGAAVAHEAALQISAMGAKWLTREDVPADVVESERRVATEKSLAEGQAREDRSEDRRRPSQRVLQGSRAARTAVRQGSVQDRRRPVQGSRWRRHRVRPRRGRQGRRGVSPRPTSRD